MRDQDWRHRQASVETHGDSITKRVDHDILEANQLAPWPVGLEKLGHPGHGVDPDPLGADRLVTEVHESGVVSHVRVGEENALEPRSFRYRRDAVEHAQLRREIRGRIDHPAFGGLGVDDGQ